MERPKTLRNLLCIFGIPDSADGVQLGIQGVGCGTAQQIDLIFAGGSDQQIRVFHTCLGKHIHGSTISVNSNHIIAFHSGFQNSGIGINDGDIVSFRGKLTGQHGTDLTVACNDNIHRNNLPIQRNGENE